MKSFSHVWLFATPWTAAYQAPLSVGFFQARVLEWGAIAFSGRHPRAHKRLDFAHLLSWNPTETGFCSGHRMSQVLGPPGRSFRLLGRASEVRTHHWNVIGLGPSQSAEKDGDADTGPAQRKRRTVPRGLCREKLTRVWYSDTYEGWLGVGRPGRVNTGRREKPVTPQNISRHCPVFPDRENYPQSRIRILTQLD